MLHVPYIHVVSGLSTSHHGKIFSNILIKGYHLSQLLVISNNIDNVTNRKLTQIFIHLHKSQVDREKHDILRMSRNLFSLHVLLVLSVLMCAQGLINAMMILVA